MTLIRELIDIPEHVAAGDFVLALADGVERPEATVGSYVVTGDLKGCFDEALALIQGALDGRKSRAAYLHGSFGSGKSHFMAVLDLVLAHHPAARGIPELGSVIAKHDPWLKDRKLLLIPYHLIGHEDLESAVFGGYVRHVRQVHPDAPLPPVYAADPVLDNAAELRKQMGDDVFFGVLGGGGDSRWGALAAGWDAARFDRAYAAEADDSDRLALVSVVVDQLLPSMRASSSGFVDIDLGLWIISDHARQLGYDGVVLFLDELILWLASRIADLDWANREGPKLAKLVESGVARRPAPLVSFIARQRDLRDLVGDQPGAELLKFFDALQWWEERFGRITLEDRNLPLIANRRLLQPRDEGSRIRLETAFEDAISARPDAVDTLLGGDADRSLFKLVYPFSPALVTTLVDVSSVLQRNRTALKVMQQLLVDQRDELTVGHIIPVGDLFDVIAGEDQPFSPSMQVQFDRAKSLYRNTLRPLLLARHHLSEADTDGLAPTHAFRGHDRLVKTLLLAALVPESEPLRNLTAARLEALNAGSIEAFIPGTERAEVIELLRWLSSQGGDVEVGDDLDNPMVAIRLHGIDTSSIVEAARSEDTLAARRVKIRDLLAADAGDPDLFQTQRRRLVWRGSRREVEVVYGNLRSVEDLPDDRLVASALPKLAIDFPFDPEGRPPADDLARVEAYTDENDDTLTLCWMPSHLSAALLRDLGDLVVHDHLLIGDNFDRRAQHLAPNNRLTARALIESRCASLRQRLRLALEEAYGVRPGGGDEYIDPDLVVADHVRSLHRGLRPRPPAAATIAGALDQLCGQLLAARYPAHPDFEAEVTRADAEKVWEEIQRAVVAPNHRIDVDRTRRAILARVANPLEVGVMYENHFVLGDVWKNRLTAAVAEARASDPAFEPNVGWVRARLDEPDPRGLDSHVANLVVLTFATQTDRSVVIGGAPVPATPRDLPAEAVLREQALPDRGVWARAVQVAGAVLGVAASDLVTADNVARLAADSRREASAHRQSAEQLRTTLDSHAARLGIDTGVHRVATAAAVEALLGGIGAAATDEAVVEALAACAPPTSLQAMGASLKQGTSVSQAVRAANWPLLERALSLGDTGAILRQRLADAAAVDEMAKALTPVLDQLETDATRLVVARPEPLASGGGESPAGGNAGTDPTTTLELDDVERALVQVQSESSGATRLRATDAAQVALALAARLEEAGEETVEISWRLDG